MGIVSWIVIGVLAGWIGSMFSGDDARLSVWTNILVGCIGGVLGGFLYNLIRFRGVSYASFNFWSLVVAAAGSIIFLMITNAFVRPSEED